MKEGGKLENRNKYLIVGIVILFLVIAVVGYFAYSQYRMSEMDKNMLKANQVNAGYDQLLTDMETLSNQSKYDEANAKMDILIGNVKEEKNLTEQAYANADGNYKELIQIQLRKINLKLDMVNDLKTLLNYQKQNDIANAMNMLKAILDKRTEFDKIQNEYDTYKSTHPEVKEHTIKYWNSTA